MRGKSGGLAITNEGTFPMHQGGIIGVLEEHNTD
jgi:hypothetical protein